MTALSCGIKIAVAAMHCLVLSKQPCDRPTDGQTGRITTLSTALAQSFVAR